MPLIVRPVNGIRELPTQPPTNQELLIQRLAWRRSELDALATQLLTELTITGDARARAERSMRKLPGVGMLLVDESVANFERLSQVGWIQVWRDERLSRGFYAMPVTQPSVATIPWHLSTIKRRAGAVAKHVSIGVIDHGYDPSHFDLQSPFAPMFAQYVDPGTTTPGGMDLTIAPNDPTPIKHGSKVCSMIAGNTNGVAPDAHLFVASITTPDYVGTQAMMACAFDWLLIQPTAAHPERPIGCDIITTSIHTEDFKTSDAGTVMDIALKEAEDWDTLVIAAIGNGGAGNWQPPGSNDTVIGVGAVDVSLNVSSFTAYGTPSVKVDKPDILAPGENLEWPVGTGKVTDSGTSFAAPIVAGAAALILQQQPALRKDVVKFRNAVLSYTSPSKSQGLIQGGRGVCDIQNV